MPYATRLSRLGITSLSERRERGDLIQVFKIFNQIEEVELCRFPTFKTDLNTRGHSMRFSREICSSDRRQNFLINRIANRWNELSQEVIESKTVDEFKINLDRYINE